MILLGDSNNKEFYRYISCLNKRKNGDKIFGEMCKNDSSVQHLASFYLTTSAITSVSKVSSWSMNFNNFDL